MAMSDDDAAYSALLAQLLSDDASSRNARVHSWIEHQYDFVLNEHPALPRPPSPSPSSSLGAHRAHSIDRPDSPLLPRSSSDRPSSPCPSYDALFFPLSKSDHDDYEEQERVRALRFIVQEMAHWKSRANSSRVTIDKPLPAPPPSPASSLTHSSSSRAVRSRSSSTRISRLPSFTSTLSSDQSNPQEIPPPLPVSVVVHGEFHHDLVLSRDRPLVDAYLHRRDDSLKHAQDPDTQLLCPVPDDLDSALQPSPTLSSFSFAHSRDTSFTTPYASSSASPTSVIFSPAFCSPENIALPTSPIEDSLLRDSTSVPSQDQAPSHQSSPATHSIFPSSASLISLSMSPPKMSVFPASPSSPKALQDTDSASQRLHAPKYLERSQSRWSIATTASITPSTTEPKHGALLNPRTPPRDKKDKSSKTPRKRTRFISLISRLSPGRNDPSSTASATSLVQTGDDVEYDSNDSDAEDKDKEKQRKSLSKKSSLASLRASFSMSRASFSSQRPPVSSPIEEVPPLPTSPTLASPLTEVVPVEVTPSISRPSLSRISSRGNMINASLPPIPQSASTITSFHSTSQLSISDVSVESRAPRSAFTSVSRISLLPPPSKRTSLASAAGIEPMVPTDLLPASQAAVRSKSIFRLPAKPKTLRTPTSPGTKAPSKLPLPGNTSLPSPATVRSRIPQAPAKFNPPAKLVTVIATQSRHIPAIASTGSASPTSKLPMPPSRIISPKASRSITSLEKPTAEGLPQSSRLPMPSSIKGARVGTVKSFWKRQ